MRERVDKLEDFASKSADRLARIETRMETFATKDDLSRLGMTMHQDMNAQTWKFISWTTTIALALVGAMWVISRSVS